MSESIDDRDNDALEACRRAYVEARHALEEYVARVCPGVHVLVQHRDAKDPWCTACGKGWDGTAAVSRWMPDRD